MEASAKWRPVPLGEPIFSQADSGGALRGSEIRELCGPRNHGKFGINLPSPPQLPGDIPCAPNYNSLYPIGTE